MTTVRRARIYKQFIPRDKPWEVGARQAVAITTASARHEACSCRPSETRTTVANKNLFQSFAGKQLRRTDAVNRAGGRAYAFAAGHALAQYAATGCLNGTYYATAAAQLETVLQLCDRVPTELIAKTAVYCRERGFMKDMPALLCALLSVKDGAICERVFDRVIDDGKMLRNFVQIVRSGVIGRKSLGSRPKRLVRRWLAQRSDEQVFRASVGQSPSLGDVIQLVHPRPETESRRALYAYLVGRAHDQAALPSLVQALEAYKRGDGELPDAPFQLLTALPLDRAAWATIARRATWQQLRMNLSTLGRHGVFESRSLTRLVAERLRDRAAIERARVLPYQLMTAYLAASSDVPELVRGALEDAMQIALANVPALDGKVYVCCDVSGSMSSPITGHRRGATTRVRCIDVAALISAAVLRKNDAEVLPFEHDVVSLRLARRDSVMTNAAKLASVGGGGTNCSAPLAMLNTRSARGALVVYVSDNESWLGPGAQRGVGCNDNVGGRGTAMMREWTRFKARNPSAKLVCIDLTPNRTTQAHDDDAILNVGGFSDVVFELLAAFASGGLDGQHWVDVIERVKL
jgi:60 kDa SS-A/Ro ribonucleoprotein